MYQRELMRTNACQSDFARTTSIAERIQKYGVGGVSEKCRECDEPADTTMGRGDRCTGCYYLATKV